MFIIKNYIYDIFKTYTFIIQPAREDLSRDV